MPICWCMLETVVSVSLSACSLLQWTNVCVCVCVLDEVLQDVKEEDISQELVKKFDAEK